MEACESVHSSSYYLSKIPSYKFEAIEDQLTLFYDWKPHRLWNIAICEVPTLARTCKDYFRTAMFDTIAVAINLYYNSIPHNNLLFDVIKVEIV